MKSFLNAFERLAGMEKLVAFEVFFLSGCKLLKNIDKRGFRFE
jgi:hypothetical protein